MTTIANSSHSEDSYGNIQKYMKETLAHQGYLKYEMSTCDPPIRELRWGRRAFLELNRLDILAWVGELNGVPPEKYSTQYEDAIEFSKEDDAPRQVTQT